VSLVAPKVEGHPRFQGSEISPTKSLGLASTATTGSSDGKLLENKDKTHHKTSYERSTDVFFWGVVLMIWVFLCLTAAKDEIHPDMT
jgi:hypothetical protein